VLHRHGFAIFNIAKPHPNLLTRKLAIRVSFDSAIKSIQRRCIEATAIIVKDGLLDACAPAVSVKIYGLRVFPVRPVTTTMRSAASSHPHRKFDCTGV
jgi:hypothetical protein